MSLLAAVRRSACRLASGSGLPPSPSVLRATKAVGAAHADACRVWDTLFARGTPTMDGAETDLCLAQYFYGLATGPIGRTSAAKATRDGIASSLRGATSDLMDATTAVLRASASLDGGTSAYLRDGAAAYMEGATNLLRASAIQGDHTAWYLDAAAGKIATAAEWYTLAASKINAKYCSRSSLGEWDGTAFKELELVNEINVEIKSAKDAKEKVKELLDNFPIEIMDKHSCSDLILTRTYLDEKIDVMVSAPSIAREKPDASAANSSNVEAEAGLALQVTITKGSTLTIFTCSSLANELKVNTMYMRLTIGEEEKEEHAISFEGSESNEMLQQLVHKYLELRGVSVMSVSFLHRLLSHRGVFIKLLWLDMFKGFVKQAK